MARWRRGWLIRAYVRDVVELLTAESAAVTAFTALSVAVLFCVDLLDERADIMDGIGKLRPAVRYGLYVFFLAAMLLLIPKTAAAPFIYFQF